MPHRTGSNGSRAVSISSTIRNANFSTVTTRSHQISRHDFINNLRTELKFSGKWLKALCYWKRYEWFLALCEHKIAKLKDLEEQVKKALDRPRARTNTPMTPCNEFSMILGEIEDSLLATTGLLYSAKRSLALRDLPHTIKEFTPNVLGSVENRFGRIQRLLLNSRLPEAKDITFPKLPSRSNSKIKESQFNQLCVELRNYKKLVCPFLNSSFDAIPEGLPSVRELHEHYAPRLIHVYLTDPEGTHPYDHLTTQYVFEKYWLPEFYKGHEDRLSRLGERSTHIVRRPRE